MYFTVFTLKTVSGKLHKILITDCIEGKGITDLGERGGKGTFHIHFSYLFSSLSLNPLNVLPIQIIYTVWIQTLKICQMIDDECSHCCFRVQFPNCWWHWTYFYVYWPSTSYLAVFHISQLNCCFFSKFFCRVFFFNISMLFFFFTVLLR